MIENIILQYLSEILNVPVSLETPEENHDQYIVFEVVDREKENFIDAVTVEFNSYADTKYNAALLDKSVRKSIENMISISNITSVEIGSGRSSGDNYDSELKKYRYRCYFNIYYYEED